MEQPGSRVRVSDAERDAAVEALREHYFAGRINVEEFTDRVEQAYTARTAEELAVVDHELPSPEDRRPRQRKPWLLPGNSSFAVRIPTRRAPQVAVEAVVRDVFAQLTGLGYAPQQEEPTRRVFVRSQRPAWAIVVAVLLFPLGLLALLYEQRSQVVVSAATATDGLTSVEVYGTAPLAVRRAIRDRAVEGLS